MPSSKESAAALAEAEDLLKNCTPKAALNAAVNAVTLAADVADRTGEAAAWCMILRARVALMKYEEALKAGEAALVLYLESGDDAGKAHAFYYIAEAHLKEGQYVKAQKAGRLALETFKTLKLYEKQEWAGAIVVHALLGMEDKQGALKQAKQHVEDLNAAGEKKLAAVAMQTLVFALVACEDEGKAKIVAKEALLIFRADGDKKLEADMMLQIARLAADLGRLDESENLAAECSTFYKDLGDQMGQAATKELLGALADAKSVLARQAASVKEVPDLVRAMSETIASKDGPAFTIAMEALYANESVSQNDIDRALGPLIEKDPEGVQRFMEDNQPGGLEPDKQTFSPKPPKGNMDDVFFRPHQFGYANDRRYLYLSMRFGGMGYGPNLRQLKTAYTFTPGKWNLNSGATTQKTMENSAEWEGRSNFLSAGLLDCALQTSSCRFQHFDKAKPGQEFDPNDMQ